MVTDPQIASEHDNTNTHTRAYGPVEWSRSGLDLERRFNGGCIGGREGRIERLTPGATDVLDQRTVSVSRGPFEIGVR